MQTNKTATNQKKKKSKPQSHKLLIVDWTIERKLNMETIERLYINFKKRNIASEEETKGALPNGGFDKSNISAT